MSRFHHFAHLSKIATTLGKYVKRGELIGYVGNSGNSTGAHLHYEVTKNKPVTWWKYVKGMTLAQIKFVYTDPAVFIKNKLPMDNSLPLAGYTYLQYVRSGNYYHPGIDLNSVNDYGKPVYAPVSGRVVFLEDGSSVKESLYSWFRLSMNQGWGRHIFIEQDESVKL